MCFLTRKWPGMIALGLMAGAAAVPATASAAYSPVVGHVYVNDNTKVTNTIGAFDRHADGTLTQQAGSPFDAGGAGTGSWCWLLWLVAGGAADSRSRPERQARSWMSHAA